MAEELEAGEDGGAHSWLQTQKSRLSSLPKTIRFAAYVVLYASVVGIVQVTVSTLLASSGALPGCHACSHILMPMLRRIRAGAHGGTAQGRLSISCTSQVLE